MEPIRYYDTKVLGRAWKALCIYINHSWGLSAGDIVDLTIQSLADKSKEVTTTKRLSTRGCSVCVYLDKSWGFEYGERVMISVVKRGSVNDAGSTS